MSGALHDHVGATADPAVPFDRRVLEAGCVAAAPRLLGALLVAGDRVGRIVEVEAYGGHDDPASHAWRGRTARNAVMFGRSGLLYMYFTYGMHWCANVVTGPEGLGEAVLVRALEPLAGLQAMQSDRPGARSVRDLCRGPARLCRAMGIDARVNGIDLLDPSSPVRVVTAPGVAQASVRVTTRVGISRATDRPWRWLVDDSRFVSPGRPS